jgi:D-beta-D-heptose 7-phosphate kinase/D-beta-D-heptose 1-phosphate adenosyltransferase
MFLDSKPQKIIVLGDIMLDYTNSGSINKLANEAPIPVFLKESEKVSLGGCGNVLQNLKALSCETLYLFSMCGDDADSVVLINLLDQLNIHHEAVKVNSKKTTSKHRFFSNNKLIFRYDIEDIYTLPKSLETSILEKLKYILETETIDCILFSDYNKGFLTNSLCESVISLANSKNVFTCVDPKNDYRKYKNCSLIKPNRNEVEKLFGITFSLDHLETVHSQIKELVCCKNTVITLGEQGISGCFENKEYFYWKYDSKDVIDVTGAGDVVNSILAYYFNQLEQKQRCLQLASYLATVSVSHMGAYTLQFTDILQGYKYLSNSKVIQKEHLVKLKKPLLFTNGCFDILHEGHISLFEYCRSIAKNEYEIVLGLNSDASIKRLKGSARPINTLFTRIAILNAIQHIDWIVVFEEDTPEALLHDLHPHILVKGGDYAVESIVGKEYCKEVKIVPFTYKISTSTIVKNIQEKVEIK